MESSGSSSSSRASAAGGPSSSAAKAGKVCGVCGDRAKSYHFGGISCDSCKAFFRRSVQNDAHENFQCPYERRCDITIASRKCCQYCRFHKCLAIGMEKSWVMTEEERLQLLRTRMERKARGSPGQSAAADPRELRRYVTAEEEAHLTDVLAAYDTSLAQVPYADALRATNDDRPVLDIVAMFTTTIERVTHFAGSLPTFAALSAADRAALLRCGMIEVCLVRLCYAYDPVRRCWPDTSRPQYRGSPYLRVDDLRKLVSPELHAMHVRFNDGLRALDPDERTYMLLLLVVLFTPDRAGLERPDLVERIQESYLLLLRRYMDWRHTPAVARRLYPKLLLKLPDLRQLNDAHTQSHLRMTHADIFQFQRQFGNILQGYSLREPDEDGGAPSTAASSEPQPSTSRDDPPALHLLYSLPPPPPPPPGHRPRPSPRRTRLRSFR